MSKIAVITSSVGAECKLLEQKKLKTADYHAFVDKEKLNSDNCWIKHEYLQFSSKNFFSNRLDAKVYKILPFLFLDEYEYFIWIDSNIILNKEPEEIVNQYLHNSDIALLKHPKRNCIYDEAKEVILKKLDFNKNIKKQYKHYKSQGYPQNNGLYDLGFHVKKNSDEMKKMSLMWWNHIIKYSSRDQISLPFVLNHFKINPLIIEESESFISREVSANYRRSYDYQNIDIFATKIKLLRAASLSKKFLSNKLKNKNSKL